VGPSARRGACCALPDPSLQPATQTQPGGRTPVSSRLGGLGFSTVLLFLVRRRRLARVVFLLYVFAWEEAGQLVAPTMEAGSIVSLSALIIK
jgi:hypothetical protein